MLWKRSGNQKVTFPEAAGYLNDTFIEILNEAYPRTSLNTIQGVAVHFKVRRSIHSHLKKKNCFIIIHFVKKCRHNALQ